MGTSFFQKRSFFYLKIEEKQNIFAQHMDKSWPKFFSVKTPNKSDTKLRWYVRVEFVRDESSLI